MTDFQVNDPSLESQWRAIILFGKNSATYKFAFAKSLLELVDSETTRISLKDLSEPFSRNIIKHLKKTINKGIHNLALSWMVVGLTYLMHWSIQSY